MPATAKRLPRRWGAALGALVGFVAMSAVAAVLVAVSVMPAVAVAASVTNTGVSTFNSLPDYLAIRPLDQQTTFYAKKGGKNVPIATFYSQNRVDVKWDQVSQYAKDAAVAAEDPRFYKEGGVDLFGTVRAALADVTTGHPGQGGSSITQQYVKNVRVQRCEQMTVPDAPAAESVPSKPVEKKYSDKESYERDEKNYEEAKKAYDRALKQHDKAEKAYEDCYADAAGPTIHRKLVEMRYAIGMEKRYTKDQILLGYLNITGFGGQIYGIQAAAEYYFGVSAKNLSLPQAATLIAIVNNPTHLRIDESEKGNPNNNAKNGFKRTLARRNYVLKRMLVHHKITQDKYEKAVKTKVTPHITPKPSGCMSAAKYDAGFFCDYVRRIMMQDPTFGKTADKRAAFFRLGGLKVYTTLNLDLQKDAQSAIDNYIPSHGMGFDLGSANTDVEVGTGRVVAMAQNRRFNNTSTPKDGTTAVNYNTDFDYGGSAGFQTGSSFKAFDLAAWLEAGHSLYESVSANQHYFPFSQFHASCTDIGNSAWPVANDSSSEGGYMSVLQATEMSVNTAFAEMGTKVDLCSISNAAKALDVHSADPDRNPWMIYPSMILGTNYIAPLTMATAYAGIANDGKVCTPIAIDKIVQSDGSTHPVPKTSCTQGWKPDIAAGVGWALQHVLTNGTAVAANPNDGVPILGKTGTTDHSFQNWLVTSTTKVASATWIGNVTGDARLRSYYFSPKNGQGPTTDGGNVKFYVAKPILAALNKKYGGDPLPKPKDKQLYGPTVTVPNIIGQSGAAAKAALSSAGLNYSEGSPVASSQAPGTVVSAYPGPGAKVHTGNTVTVHLSTGKPAPPKKTSPPKKSKPPAPPSSPPSKSHGHGDKDHGHH